MTASTHHLDDTNFDTTIKNATGPVLVDFWAAWCAPCRIIGPTVDELAGDYDGRATIAKVDVDANPAIAARFNIRSIPTILVFDGGDVVDTFVGVTAKTELARTLDARLASAA